MDAAKAFHDAVAAEMGCCVGEAKARGLTHEEAIDELVSWQGRAMAKYGYFIHYVADDPDTGLAKWPS